MHMRMCKVHVEHPACSFDMFDIMEKIEKDN